MADNLTTEQDLLDSIEEGLHQGYGMPEGPVQAAKRDSLEEMTKSLPEWSLEPPETFLA